MCNLFLSLRPPTGRHSLILLSNRDEVLARPTAEADWRDGILAGIDLQIPLKGTWFCINKQGKIGLLLAITQLPEHRRPDAKSRGRIAPDFLLSPMEGKEYCDSLKSTADEYDGFTFVAIDRPSGEYEMHSFTNAHVDELETKEWPKAAHVVGNCPPHTTYKKMERGRELLDEIAESLFAMGQDRVQCYPDAQLDSQVCSEEFEARSLSAIFYRIGRPAWYGTRSQTALIIDNDGSVFVRERRFLSIDEEGNEEWASKDFSFKIPPITK